MEKLFGFAMGVVLVGFVMSPVPVHAGSTQSNSKFIGGSVYQHPTCSARAQGCQVSTWRGLGLYLLPAEPTREMVHPTCAGRGQGCQVPTWRGLGLSLPAEPTGETVHPTCAGRGQGCQVPTWRGLGLNLPAEPTHERVR